MFDTNTSGKVGKSSLVMYSYGPLHMAVQKQGDQLEPTYSISGDTGCSPEDLPKATNERGSGISVLIAWQDDDDDDLKNLTVYKQMRCYNLLKIKLVTES